MKGYKGIEKEFEINSALRNEVNTLFKLFLQLPKTEFIITDLPEEFTLLRERNELKDWNSGTLKLEGGDAFFFLWFKHLREQFPIELSVDFSSINEFIDKVDGFYRDQKIQRGLYSLINRLEQWLIITLNRDFDCDFYNYALSLKKEEGRDIHDFADRFGNALPFLKISVDRLTPVILHLGKELRDNTTMNYPDGSIRIGLKDLVFANPGYGQQLLATLKASADSDEYQALVLSGLIEQGGVAYLNKIKANYPDEGQQILANALSLLRKTGDDLASAVLGVVHSFNRSNYAVIQYVPSICYSIIQFGTCTDELGSKAFSVFIELWNTGKEIKPLILGQLQYMDGFESERRAFLIEAFKDADVNIASIGNMHGLHKIVTPDFMFDLVIVIAGRVKLQFDVKILEYLLHELEEKDNGDFSRVLIRLLIHENGYVRFAGSRIYTHLTFGRRKFRFRYDVLSLQELEQIKLIIAILTEVNPPQDTLANILKLCDSPHSRVVVLLTLKLKSMVEAFFDSVNQEMQAGLDSEAFVNIEVMQAVKEYHEQFIKDIDEKEKLKELNPWLNEYKLINYYTETTERKNSRMIKQSMGKNSFLTSFFTNVNLAKGGGWKVEGKDSVQKLGNFSSSAPFPRIYFIAPEYLDRVISNKYLVSWQQIFQWEQIQL